MFAYRNRFHYLAIQHLSPLVIREFVTSFKPINTDYPLIRIGSPYDGGYLIPDDIQGIKACFSPGVSNNASFELHLAQRGIPCYLADYSVDTPPCTHPLIHFDRRFLGPKTVGNFLSLSDWISLSEQHHGDLLLQMDIEGAEYNVLTSLNLSTLKRFRIIVLELHGLGQLASLKTGLFDTKKLIRCAKLLSRHFYTVHLHPNNVSALTTVGKYELPDYLEVTLIRKDRVRSRSYAKAFPHQLDAPNIPSIPDLVLPQCFYS